MNLTSKLRCILLCCIPAVTACQSRTPADEFIADPAGLERGKALFVGTCGGYCHSATSGPRDAPYLFDCQWIHGGRDEEIFATISIGVPNTRMVSFGGKLPEGDDDIWRIIAYLKSERGAC